MKLRDIINMPLFRLKELSKKELSKAYDKVVKQVKKSVRGFEKQGLERVLPKKVTTEMPKTPTAKNISELSNFLLGYKANVTKFMKAERKQMRLVESRLSTDEHEFRFHNYEEYEEYKRFLGAMQERLGENWKKVSSSGADLYAHALRLNLNPNQFLANIDYWIAHSKDLNKAEPLSRQELFPSDYARKLKLPKIRGGGNYGD